MLLTLAVRDVLHATPRARLVKLDLGGRDFPYDAGQAVFIGAHGAAERWPYSIASAPEDATRDGSIELLVGVDAEGATGHGLRLQPGSPLDVDGPVGSFTFPR